MDFKGESIPGGGTNNGECVTLPSCSLAQGTNSWPVTEERRARRSGRPDTGLQSSQLYISVLLLAQSFSHSKACNNLHTCSKIGAGTQKIGAGKKLRSLI